MLLARSDDGGEGAEFSLCPLGSDCQDCGPRAVAGLCHSNCSSWGSDGECDDGGDGAEFDLCEIGTDCFDCGPRQLHPPPPMPPMAPAIPSSPFSWLNDTGAAVDTPGRAERSVVAVAAACSAAFVVVILAAVGYWCRRRRKQTGGLLRTPRNSGAPRGGSISSKRFASFSASHTSHVEMLEVTPDKSAVEAAAASV